MLVNKVQIGGLGGGPSRKVVYQNITLDDADAKEKERANDRQDVSMGVMNDWEYRAKWYGESPEEAKKMLPKMENMTTEGQEELE